MLLMVFVDEIGAAYPQLNHSPWDSVTLADYVMPWFLFMVGTSLSISLKKFKLGRRVEGTKSVVTRALKLFGLGLLLQGGDPGWIGGYAYGYNLATLRFMGILQRIAFAYLIGALIELWIPERPRPLESSRVGFPHLLLFGLQAWRWLLACAFVLLHLCLTLWLWVPSWTSHYGWNRTLCPEAASCDAPSVRLVHGFDLACDVRGALHTPECSAAGHIDRALFGQDHLGAWMSMRLPQCSSCSPGQPDSWYRPECRWLRPGSAAADDADDADDDGAPAWCYAHIYDPEGALATLPTVMSVWLGAHFGRVLHFEPLRGRRAILTHWAACALALLLGGLLISLGGLPMNKQLWSPSYLFFTAGTCGAALTIAYAAVDATPPASEQRATGRAVARFQARLRWLLFPLEATGMNAILFFFWHGTAEALLDAAYVQPPRPAGAEAAPRVNLGADSSVEGWLGTDVLGWVEDHAARQLLFMALKLACYMLVAVACYRNEYFWKL